MSAIQLPSNRSFGSLFVGVFALLGAFSWWRGGALWPWLAALSALTLIVTAAAPAMLTPLNRAWMKLAELLHRVVSPIVLGLIFFGIFAPVGFVMRLAGRDALKRRFEAQAGSYWIDRQPPGPDPAGLPNQF